MKQKLKERLKEDQEERASSGKGIFKSGTGVTFWNPGGGDHLIDIIPYIAGTNHPTVPEGEPAYVVKLSVHYAVGATEDKSFICLKETYDKPCPICLHRTQLRSEGAEDDVWKALFPKKRTVYNVYCWDSGAEEEKGVQVWEVSDWYFQKHLDTLAKGARRPGREYEKRIDYIDPDEGKSIAFTIKPPRSKNDFAEYLGHRFDDRDYTISDELLEGAQTLDELLLIPTFEEVYQEYWGEPYEDGVVDETVEDEDYEDVPEDETVEEEYEDLSEEEEYEDIPDDQEQAEIGEEEELVCPGGGEIGVDTNELEYCEECEIWDACLDRQAELEEEKQKPKPKPKPKAKPKRVLRRKK